MLGVAAIDPFHPIIKTYIEEVFGYEPPEPKFSLSPPEDETYVDLGELDLGIEEEEAIAYTRKEEVPNEEDEILGEDSEDNL